MNRIILTIALLVMTFSFTAICFAEELETDITDAKENTVVLLETSLGNISITLDAEAAPQTVANFKQYVTDGFYDGTIFHRVIPGFMVQGGGFLPNMKQKTTRDSIQNEANNGLPNKKYSIAMARMNDPHSASAQFFINIKDNDFLNYKSEGNWGYAVFGEVTEGQDVVEKIVAVPTASKGMHEAVPVEAVTIIKATLAK